MVNTPHILGSSRHQHGPLELSAMEAEALAFLLPLSEDYPGIEAWYRAKVVPGLRTGTRTLKRVERDGRLIGLGIAKTELGEFKICSVRVDPTYANRGVGVRIFDGLLKWLNVDRPFLTVSAGKLPKFERIFSYYGFNVTSVYKGLYVPHSCELGYNEARPALSASELATLQILRPERVELSRDLVRTHR